MARPQRKSAGPDEGNGIGGFLGGLGQLIEKLGELAEKGEELKGVKEFGEKGGIHGVYGFTIKSNLVPEGKSGGVKVEPFGNVRKDDRTGRVRVHEVAEPLVDVFEEPDHVLVVAELPGVGLDDIKIELHEDLLTISGESGPKKYRKEVLLPAAFPADSMSSTCRNGVLEVRFNR
jgi:HSP20 family protein